MSWTPERIETLKKLWMEGCSAGAAALQLGGVSRNAVIGKLHRLGFNKRRKTPTQARRESGSARGRANRRKAAKPTQKSIVRDLFRAVSFVPEPLPTGSDLVPLVSATADLEPHHCRWIPGEPSSGYCGRTRHLGLSYCEHHAKRAFQAPKTPEVPGRNPAGTTAEPAELEAA